MFKKTAPSPTALARPADPLFSPGENSVCQFPWWQTHCFMAALKSILSNDTCSLTFCQIRGLFGRVYISQQQGPLHSYSQCSGTNGEEKSPVNYVCAISFLWMCFVAHVMPDWIHLNCRWGHAEQRGTWSLMFSGAHVRECYHVSKLHLDTNFSLR